MTGIAHQTGLTQFTVKSEDCSADRLFDLLAVNDLSVDFINISPEKYVFNLNREHSLVAKTVLSKAEIPVSIVEDCVKVSIVGAGIMGTPGITAKMVGALMREKIEILQTTDSYTTIWVLVHGKDLKRAVNVLHETFLGE